MNLDPVIAVRNNKTIYRDGDRCIKVFNAEYSKADVLNEALNQARVEETGLNIPKVLEVTMIDGKWSIVSEFIKGKTLAQLMEENPEKKAEYIELLVDLQMSVHAKTAPLLNKLKDKMSRKIAETELDASTRYDLHTRLEGMLKHNKVCHGDFTPLQHYYHRERIALGSCIGGPVMEKYHSTSPIKDYVTIADYAGERDFDVDQPASMSLKKHFTMIEHKLSQPSDDEILTVLRQMGKTKPSDELNCGSYGYNSCREKAVAIIQGNAESSMCLPFLKDKAESFSDTIVKNTPNGLTVLNEDLEVQPINTAARRIMNIRAASDVLGEPVIRILDPTVFLQVKNSGRTVRDQRTYLAEYKKFIEQTVVYDPDSRMLIGIMRDITDEEGTFRKGTSHKLLLPRFRTAYQIAIPQPCRAYLAQPITDGSIGQVHQRNNAQCQGDFHRAVYRQKSGSTTGKC